MRGSQVYLLGDELGPQGVDIFPSAVQESNLKVEVRGFAAYVVTNRLDMPGFAFTNVVRQEASQSTFMIPISFGSELPNFAELGLEVTPTEQGIVIHVSPESFNVLDSEGTVFRIRSGNWFEDKATFQAIGCLKHLGIIEEFNNQALRLVPDYLEKLTMILHQRYGTHGSLTDALPLAFDRIKFAIRIFGISEAIQILKTFTTDEVCFGGLLPALVNNSEVKRIRQLLPGSTKSDSPFLILTDYLRAIFDSLNALGISIPSIDDYSAFEGAIHRFQRDNELPLGICDILVGERIIKSAALPHHAPVPILAMADIDVAVLREVNFLPFDPIPNEENDSTIAEMNATITKIHNPKAKIDWMNSKIEEHVVSCDSKCCKLSQRIALSERRIDELSKNLQKIMRESEAAVSRVEAAYKTLNTVCDAEMRINNKFDYLRNKLHSEQRNTRMTIVIGVILVVFGIVRLFTK